MLAFLVLVLFNVNQSLAFWRLPCHRAGAARVDPIISPGEPSAHLHILHGGKSMSSPPSMSSTLSLTYPNAPARAFYLTAADPFHF